MELKETIYERRSIRKFKSETLPKEIVEAILKDACQAPSGGNRQNWYFVIVEGKQKESLLELLEQKVERLKKRGIKDATVANSIRCMKEAPTLILVFNTGTKFKWFSQLGYRWIRPTVDLQAIGGAIQTLLLSAYSRGIASLWIGDILFGCKEISQAVGEKGQLVAAVALGYGAQSPKPRPRKKLEEVIKWIK